MIPEALESSLFFADELHAAILGIEQNTKNPFARSRGVDDATSDVATIRLIAQHHPGCNAGVACGVVSRLVGLDIDDDVAGVSDTIAREPAFRNIGPRNVKGPSARGELGGHRIYSTTEHLPSRAVLITRGIEFKSNGSYLITAGSALDDGARRWEWCNRQIRPLPSGLRELVLDVPDFTPRAAVPMTRNRVLDCAVVPCYRMRNRCLSILARGGKLNLGLTTESELYELFIEWYHRNVNNMRTKSIRVSWREFLSWYRSAEVPLGNTLDEVAWNHDPLDIPEFCMKYKKEYARRLLSFIHDLAATQAGGVFFFGTYEAQERLRIKQKTCWNWMRRFADDGIIEVVERGNRQLANTYRWIGATE